MWRHFFCWDGGVEMGGNIRNCTTIWKTSGKNALQLLAHWDLNQGFLRRIPVT